MGGLAAAPNRRSDTGFLPSDAVAARKGIRFNTEGTRTRGMKLLNILVVLGTNLMGALLPAPRKVKCRKEKLIPQPIYSMAVGRKCTSRSVILVRQPCSIRLLL